jgi:Na+-driven multidrug efflux pump
LAYVALVSAALSVLLAWTLSASWNLNGVVLAMLLSELLIAGVCFFMVYKVILNKKLSQSNSNLSTDITKML